MRLDSIEKFWYDCLQKITSEGAGQYIKNPAIQFTLNTKAGKYDDLDDEEYAVLLDETEELSKLWGGSAQKTAGDLLLDGLEGITPPVAQMNQLTGLLTECQAQTMPGSSVRDRAMSTFPARTPREIRDTIAGSVIGQPEAVKSAALIVHSHLSGRRRSAVFCGPSGSGKSETWRALSKGYPGLIRIVDFSRFSAEGWKGSLHLRDIFEGINTNDIRRHGLIVVLDEADKIICEHAVGSSGTDYNAIVQNSLLKMLDGDVIEFGVEDKRPAFSVDCSKVSVVMLGAFGRLLENKTHDAKRIGFGAMDREAGAGDHKDISYKDLINAGMRREVAGRINKIIALDQLDLEDYEAILKGPVLSGLEQSFQCGIRISDEAASALAEQAVASGLGVRWMRSALLNAIDDAIFDAPDARDFRITMRDGKLNCQKIDLRKAVHGRGYTAYAAPEEACHKRLRYLPGMDG